MPSLLAAHPGRLEEACRLCEVSGSDSLHLDIMDGHFVPNLSMGPAVVRMARETVKIPLSVHLMITRPDRYADTFIRAGGDTILIHIEADCDVKETLRKIRDAGVRPGITLNPDTPADAIADVMSEELADEILCMTVHPGFGGQAFIDAVLPKMRTLRQRYPDTDISVDGGLDIETSARSAAQGANIFMAGTSLFKAEDMREEIRTLRERTISAWNDELLMRNY